MAAVPPDPQPCVPRASSASRRRRRGRHRARAVQAVDRTLPRLARAGLGALLLAALAAGAAGLGWVAWASATGADPYRLGRPGVHFEGEALPAGHALLRPAAAAAAPAPRLHAAAASAPSPAPGLMRVAATAGPLPAEPPLRYRQHCVWGRPGSNPYRGTVVQALQSARLPDEVVRQVAAQVAAKHRSDRLEIRRDGIRALGSGRVFDPRRVALTYGETLCVGSRVNFTAGHMEPADLYEAADAQGRVYAVMVPEVCGNVSVLSQQGERRRPHLLATADNAAPGPLRRLPAALEDGGGDGVFAFADARQRNEVPEPGTLGGVVIGLVALAAFRRRR